MPDGLIFETRVDMFFVGGRVGLKRFRIKVLDGFFSEMINVQLNFELICFLTFVGLGLGLGCQLCWI